MKKQTALGRYDGKNIVPLGFFEKGKTIWRMPQECWTKIYAGSTYDGCRQSPPCHY